MVDGAPDEDAVGELSDLDGGEWLMVKKNGVLDSRDSGEASPDGGESRGRQDRRRDLSPRSA